MRGLLGAGGRGPSGGRGGACNRAGRQPVALKRARASAVQPSGRSGGGRTTAFRQRKIDRRLTSRNSAARVGLSTAALHPPGRSGWGKRPALRQLRTVFSV